MGIFDPPEPKDVAAIGRTHRALAELHYEDGVDNWWFQGHLVVVEAGFVEGQWDPTTRSWSFHPETASGPGKPEWAALATSTAEPRPGQRRVRMPHRIYYFEDIDKADRRYLHTADLDLISAAPQLPYNETEKGAKRFQAISFAVMAAIDMLTLLLMFSTLTSVTPGAVSYQIGTGVIFSVAQVIGWPASLLALYYFMGRRTRVIVIDVRPMAMRLGSPRNELVYLTNSSKEPAANYLRRVFGLPSAAIEGLSQVVSMFSSEVIQRLQEEVRESSDQMDATKLAGARAWESSVDLGFLAISPGVQKKNSWVPTAVIAGVAATVVGLLVYVLMISGA